MDKSTFDVVDPLCGFRGIPLAPTVALLDEVETGDRMEFDPELVIHLHRRGVRVRTLLTRVVYNPGGLSHFDTWRDNMRLSRVYARSLLSTPGLLTASRRAGSGKKAEAAR